MRQRPSRPQLPTKNPMWHVPLRQLALQELEVLGVVIAILSCSVYRMYYRKQFVCCKLSIRTDLWTYVTGCLTNCVCSRIHSCLLRSVVADEKPTCDCLEVCALPDAVGCVQGADQRLPTSITCDGLPREHHSACRHRPLRSCTQSTWTAGPVKPDLSIP
jgi:hypothetical protein